MRWQLFSERYLVVDRRACAVRSLATGLVEAIVEDEEPVRWDRLRNCGMDDDELFTIARAEAAAVAGEITRNVIDGITVCVSTGQYLSAAMLHEMRLLGNGAFFAPVSRHHWCTHAISATTNDAHVQMMQFLAQALSNQLTVRDAARLTSDVYWIQHDHIERVAVADAMRLTGR